MLTQLIRLAAATAVAFAAISLTPAFAQDEEIDRECVRACRDEARTCRDANRDAGRTCLEDAGCDVLRDEYRDACLTDERDDEACADARQALRDCVAPCREARRDAAMDCREAFALCLSDECGIDEPLKRPRRGRRGKRGGKR